LRALWSAVGGFQPWWVYKWAYWRIDKMGGFEKTLILLARPAGLEPATF